MEPLYAVDADGAPVRTDDFTRFFTLDEATGELSVAAAASGGAGVLDRSAAAVITLAVASTEPPQYG